MPGPPPAGPPSRIRCWTPPATYLVIEQIENVAEITLPNSILLLWVPRMAVNGLVAPLPALVTELKPLPDKVAE